MRLANSLETYGLIHQLLHWATAILIFVLIPLGVYMHELPIGTEAEISEKVWLYSLHKTLGVLLLAVALARVGWAILQPHPRGLHGGLEGFAAQTVHWLLYASIIAMPVLGWIHHAATEGYAPIWWPFSQNLPLVPESETVSHFFKTAHQVTGFLLAGCLFLHVAGAIKHAVIDKDHTLARMVPGAYAISGEVPPERGSGKAAIAASVVTLMLATFVTVGVYSWQTASVNSPATGLTLATSSQAWFIDKQNSSLKIEITQMGAPVQGSFEEWQADVVFDPDRLDASQIEAQIVISSLRLGEITAQATSADFLDASQHPYASFKSQSIVKTETGFAADGQLLIAGVEKQIILPFTFEETDGAARVSAALDLARLDFGVGKTFSDDSSVGRMVRVLISIEAKRP